MYEWFACFVYLKMEAVYLSKLKVNLHKITRPHIPEDSTLRSHGHVNLKYNRFEVSCSYPPACQVLLSGCSLATDAVNLVYEYHRTLSLVSCIFK